MFNPPFEVGVGITTHTHTKRVEFQHWQQYENTGQ